MKFIVGQSTLLKALTLCGKAISSNVIVPIQESYRFKLENGILEITGSGLGVFIIQRLTVESSDDFCIAIPAKILLSLIGKLADQPLVFTLSKDWNLQISYSSGKGELSVEDGEDYPLAKTGEGSTFTIDNYLLLECINKTLFAVGDDELRPAMMGVLMEIKNKTAVFTATNANLLSTFEMPVSFEGSITSIIPGRALGFLQSIPSKTAIAISISDRSIKFDVDKDTTVISVLIDERFPDYMAVIPTGHENTLLANKEELKSGLSRIAIFAADSGMVKFDLGEQVKIESSNIDYKRQADETLEATYDGEPMQVGLSSKYLAQALPKLKTEQVYFSFGTANKPVLLRDNNGTGKSNLMLIMPMMLNY